MAKKTYKKPQISREELKQALVEANDALWRANQRLEAEEKSRQELLSNLSHDLRAPLTALKSSVELLLTKPDMEPEEYQNLLNVMERRLNTLQEMINDLFLLTKVENPQEKPELVSMKAGFFLEEFFYSCEADSKFQNRVLELEVPEQFPYLIRIDAVQMIRVLDNLFANALRYSNEGARITLRAEYIGKHLFPGIAGACEDAVERKAVCITVRDTGIGILPQDLPHVFERAYRSSRSRTPGDGGSGLGLAIAKGIVERHGGEIRCESEPDKGSSFYIILPCESEF